MRVPGALQFCFSLSNRPAAVSFHGFNCMFLLADNTVFSCASLSSTYLLWGSVCVFCPFFFFFEIRFFYFYCWVPRVLFMFWIQVCCWMCNMHSPPPVACHFIPSIVNTSNSELWYLIVVLICIRSFLSLDCGVLVKQLWRYAKCSPHGSVLKRGRLLSSFLQARL